MAELGTVEAPKNAGYVVSASRNTAFMKRIEDDEKEIAELERRNRGEPEEPKEVEAQPATEEKAETEEKLSAEEETFKKRYGDLRKHANKLAERIKELESTDKSDSITPPKSEAEVVAWMKKYPDVAAIVEAIADKKAAEKFAGAEARLKQIDAMSAEAERKKNESEIRAVHKDFDELRDSDKFHEWAAEQPKWVQDALYENADDPKSVIKVIDLYKYENGFDVKGRKAAAKEAASAVMTKRAKTEVDADSGNKKIYESVVQKMSTREYESRQDEIMEAIRNRTFVYDISGGAR